MDAQPATTYGGYPRIVLFRIAWSGVVTKNNNHHKGFPLVRREWFDSTKASCRCRVLSCPQPRRRSLDVVPGPTTRIPGRYWCTVSCQHSLRTAPHAAHHVVAVTWCCTRAAVLSQQVHTPYRARCRRCWRVWCCDRCRLLEQPVVASGPWRRKAGRWSLGHSNPSTLTPKGRALGHGQALVPGKLFSLPST